VPPRAHALTAADTRKAPPSSSASISWMSIPVVPVELAPVKRGAESNRHASNHKKLDLLRYK